MTTLELARVIAEAARASAPDAAAVTVLEVLETNGFWFCRLYEADGVTREAPVTRGLRSLERAEYELLALLGIDQ